MRGLRAMRSLSTWRFYVDFIDQEMNSFKTVEADFSRVCARRSLLEGSRTTAADAV